MTLQDAVLWFQGQGEDEVKMMSCPQELLLSPIPYYWTAYLGSLSRNCRRWRLRSCSGCRSRYGTIMAVPCFIVFPPNDDDAGDVLAAALVVTSSDISIPFSATASLSLQSFGFLREGRRNIGGWIRRWKSNDRSIISLPLPRRLLCFLFFLFDHNNTSFFWHSCVFNRKKQGELIIILNTSHIPTGERMFQRNYLVHFVDRHIDFRYAELDAIVEMLGVDPEQAYER